eukprot:jgi/Picsp_1/4145/NSC_01654-R1_---NA---
MRRRCGRDGGFLSNDADIQRQRRLVEDAIACRAVATALRRGALNDLSGEYLWTKYQIPSVIPSSTYRFVIDNLKYRRMAMHVVSHGGVELTTNVLTVALEYASRYGMIDTVASIVASGKIPPDDESFSKAFAWAAKNEL